MSVGIEWAILAVAILALFWAFHEKRRITRDSKDQLAIKLEIVRLDKELVDERHRAEQAEHELRMGPAHGTDIFSSISEMFERWDEPPQVFHNGVLLAPGLDYTRDDGTGDLRFEIPLRIRDVVQVRGHGGTVVILDHNVPVGEALSLTPNVAAEDRSEVLTALREAAEKADSNEGMKPSDEPKPISRYDRLAQDDEEQP